MVSARRGAPGPSRRVYGGRLLAGNHEIVLREGVTLIGRGAGADIGIQSTLVSREHARIVQQGAVVTIEDLGSTNGVFVNGLPIASPTLLVDGDTILIGTLQLSFFHVEDEPEPPSGRVLLDETGRMTSMNDFDESCPTLVHAELDVEQPDDITIQSDKPPVPRSSGMHPVTMPSMQAVSSRPPVSPPASSPLPSPEPRRSVPLAKVTLTMRRDEIVEDPVVGVVRRMLERGDIDAADRTLSGQVRRWLELSARGTPPSRAVAEAAAGCALELAEVSNRALWVDLMLELCTAARLPLTDPLLTKLERVMAALASRPGALATYQTALRSMLGELSAEQLVLAERVLYLELDV